MKKHLNKSMVEFVKDSINPENFGSREVKSILNYANALSQTPRLGHFIPCDENDVPLKNPFATDNDAGTEKELLQIKYNNACDLVLFEGCKVLEYNKKVSYIQCRDEVFGIGFKKGMIQTIEDLIKHNLPLTEVGGKFFGL